LPGDSAGAIAALYYASPDFSSFFEILLVNVSTVFGTNANIFNMPLVRYVRGAPEGNSGSAGYSSRIHSVLAISGTLRGQACSGCSLRRAKGTSLNCAKNLKHHFDFMK